MHTYAIVKRINIIHTCSLFSEETQLTQFKSFHRWKLPVTLKQLVTLSGT